MQTEKRITELYRQSLKLRESICQIGRCLWERGFVDGNGGNILVRLESGPFLCTPTLVSKSMMSPDSICLIDASGKQIMGNGTRSSEALTHLTILNQRPEITASIHCHPPMATAFAVCGILPPVNLTPEGVVFLEPALVEYQLPGSEKLSQAISKAVLGNVNVLLLANHGLITFAKDLPLAYFLTENFETVCKLWVDSQTVATLAKGMVHQLNSKEIEELLPIRKKLGL